MDTNIESDVAAFGKLFNSIIAVFLRQMLVSNTKNQRSPCGY